MNTDAISTLTDGELKGWWLCVMVWRVQAERDGERAALMDRARKLGIDLKYLDLQLGSDIKEASEEGAGNTDPALDIADLERRPEDA